MEFNVGDLVFINDITIGSIPIVEETLKSKNFYEKKVLLKKALGEYGKILEMKEDMYLVSFEDTMKRYWVEGAKLVTIRMAA